MSSSNQEIQHSQNLINNESEQNEPMIDQNNQQSNTFTSRQIQIIRSYIGDLNIEKNENESSNELKNIVQRIQKETQLESKSVKEIQAMIHKLLFSQSSSGSQKISNKEIGSDAQHKIGSNKQVYIQAEKKQNRVDPQIKADTQKQQNVFQPKFLFRSFFENTQKNQDQNKRSFDQIQGNSYIGLRNVNSITKSSFDNIISKNSSELIKKGSNGFMSILDSSLSKNKQANEGEQNNFGEFPSFSKKGTKQFKQSSQIVSFKSKRKIKPTIPLAIDPLLTSQQKMEWIQSNTNDCHSILQKKMFKKSANSSKQAFYVNQKFSNIYNEHFYSSYDRIYFNQQSSFNKLLSSLGCEPKTMNFKTFKLIKKALPQPKLFSIQFLISQQNKLNQFRSQLRQLPKEKARSQDIELIVGKEVTALHPVCGHLHSGTILAIYKQNQYMVKFLRPQLGTQKVLDINISTRSLSTTNKATIENIDYESMVMVIKLLQYKGDLMEKFKQYNDRIEEIKEQGKLLDNQLLQQYGWIGSTINILSMGLRHIIAKFRIRGVNQSNQQIVGKNFSSLLINPLNLMSKQLQNSSQFSDRQTSYQIKKMASNRSFSRIEQIISKLGKKNEHLLEESEMNPEQRQSMSNLLKNFLGMLLNLRYDGRNFNIESNKYLNNILAMIDGEYSEYFNQIYANIHTIVKKIADTQ